MKPFASLEGVITVGGSTIFTVPPGKSYQVLALRVNNPAAYDFTVSKYTASSATTYTIYTLSLSAGDTVTDSWLYMFEPGDQLIIDSSIAGTTYIIDINLGF